VSAERYIPARPRRLRVHVQAGDVYLIPGDIHFPIQDADAVSAMANWFEGTYPSAEYRRGVVLQGDTIDAHSVSRHQRKPARLAAFPRLVDEAKEARPFLEWAGSQQMGATYIEGNHEDWVTDLVDAQPGLAGAPGMAFPALVGLNDVKGIEWMPQGTWVQLGDLVAVCHGDAKGFPGVLASVRRKYPRQFTVYGHTHRSGISFWTTYDFEGSEATYGAMNVGHLSMTPEYLGGEDPDWQRAFGVVEFFGDRGDGRPFYRPTLHHVVRGKNGRVAIA
jgi:predicted phosphodiesterase